MAKDDKNKDHEEDDLFNEENENFDLPELDFDDLEDGDLDLDDDDFLANLDEELGLEEDDLNEDNIFGDSDSDGVVEEVTNEISETSNEVKEAVEETISDTQEAVSEALDFSSSEDSSDTEIVSSELEGLENVDFSSDEVSIENINESSLSSVDEFDFTDEELASFESEEGLQVSELQEDTVRFGQEESQSSQENVAATADSVEDDASKHRSKFIKYVLFGILGFLVLGLGIWFIFGKSSGEKDKKELALKKNKKAKKKKKVSKNPKTVAKKETSKSEKSKQVAINSKTKTSKPVNTVSGEINRLSARTGNFHIIIGSFVDSDMANDLAKKLARQGKSPVIIPPYGSGMTHRVGVASFGSVDEATNELDNYRNEYAADAWVLKY